MSKIRVALIEDHELTRVGIRRALQQQPEVELVGTATNATEGLQMVLTEQPDVAIVDIGLPDQDGNELQCIKWATPALQASPQDTRITA